MYACGDWNHNDNNQNQDTDEDIALALNIIKFSIISYFSAF